MSNFPLSFGSYCVAAVRLTLGALSSSYLECGELIRYVSLEGHVDTRHGVSRLFPELQQSVLSGQEKKEILH